MEIRTEFRSNVAQTFSVVGMKWTEPGRPDPVAGPCFHLTPAAFFSAAALLRASIFSPCFDAPLVRALRSANDSLGFSGGIPGAAVRAFSRSFSLPPQPTNDSVKDSPRAARPASAHRVIDFLV